MQQKRITLEKYIPCYLDENKNTLNCSSNFNKENLTLIKDIDAMKRIQNEFQFKSSDKEDQLKYFAKESCNTELLTSNLCFYPSSIKETKPTLFKKELNFTEKFKKLKLRRNELYSPEPTHEFLPYDKKNDEVYKIKLVRFLRNPKCVNRSVFKRKFSELENNNVKSLIKFISEKKIFKSVKYFTTNKFTHAFMTYRDSDIGFDKLWQSQLNETVNLIKLGNG